MYAIYKWYTVFLYLPFHIEFLNVLHIFKTFLRVKKDSKESLNQSGNKGNILRRFT